ncbi:chlorophyll synthase ChlG [Sphingomonas baiyangensis]|uniref:Chlorophyll synthase ChlG n=1 Tax=Sphingomonas baiyangensis TaxID=2572576 RepID=A0A4U1L3U1_9SPHN|nr:chlorophyll synthase ChlG [Sphingomonas baiyangensis]TKD51402.1 chlorophyll synthase ChlG [Sphingomonas baiyangensis]
MDGSTTPPLATPLPRWADVIELLKPITWFPPIWAFVCGVVSSGVPVADRWSFLVAGIALTGPLVCGTSQAVNDWFDRHVDAINQPERPIPSGRIGGQWGWWIACAGSLLAMLVAWATGPWIALATLAGLALAWAYSAPPLRLKTDALLGPGAVALSYEGLTWFTGAAVMAGGLPRGEILAVLLLYAAGAWGIMTLNDFKAVRGDLATGVRSLPARLGMARAVRIACIAMVVPQLVVIVLLARWDMPVPATVVACVLAGQALAMRRLVADPARHAPWYNAVGVALYVLGMMAAAAGLGGLW